MTVLEGITAALRKINVTEPTAEDISAALVTFNNLADNFLFWIEGDCPALPFTLTDTLPFKPHYNDALIVKLAIKEAIPYNVPVETVALLKAEDTENMHKLDYRNALNRFPKAGMTVT